MNKLKEKKLILKCIILLCVLALPMLIKCKTSLLHKRKSFNNDY